MVVRLKTKRMRRFTRLDGAGFLPFEAREISRVPFTVPYMGQLIRARHIRFTWAKKRGLDYKAYAKEIKEMYAANNWYKKRTRLGVLIRRRICNPWDLLRDFEDRYRAKHPEYQSPGEKKRRRFRRWERDYQTKKYADDEKYMGRGR